jgi:hypothetical protein
VAITGDMYVHANSKSKRAAMASVAKIIGP